MKRSQEAMGGMFVVEPSGTVLTDDEKRELEALRPAGIMVRSRNFLQDCGYDVWFDAFAKLLHDVRQAIGRERLIVSIDHEGGRIIRPPAPITRFPYAARWGNAIAEVATAMAVELQSLGVNLTCSPVADVHSNPANPVINQRAFGCTPQQAADGASLFFETMRRHEIACCAKHFPGHGDTAVDSHFELPILTHTLEDLHLRELIPFRALIERSIPAVMTGHLMVPALDRRYPATLSKAIINGVLRREMGFDGAVISDGLGMKAIIDRLDEPGTLAAAVDAGLDLFLVVGDDVSIADAQRWANVLADDLADGTLSGGTLDATLGRVDTLLNELATFQPYSLGDEVFARHHTLAGELDANGDWEEFHLNLPGFE